MTDSLRGKVALVTGASSGVGWQTALRLAGRGAKVCITARRRAALELLRDEIQARGGEAHVVPGDVSNPDDVDWTVACAIAHFRQLDILVNNAAVRSYATFEASDWEDIERVFEVGCFGYMRFAKAALRHFRERGQGRIVNVLSMLSVGASPHLSAYVGSQHALLGWADSLRIELEGTKIEVSNVLLPSIATPMFDHAATHGMTPRPMPPTYDVDVAARAVVRCLGRPSPRYVPVFLHGRVQLWADRWAPWLGKALASAWREHDTSTKELTSGQEGNLYKPVFRGIGPRGTIQPTAKWKRYGAAAGIVGAFAVLAGAFVWVGAATRA